MPLGDPGPFYLGRAVFVLKYPPRQKINLKRAYEH